MPREFHPATAEQVVISVEASVVRRSSVDALFVADFADMPDTQAKTALLLAEDIGFIKSKGKGFEPNSPLCRLLISPNEHRRAAAFRILLESYEPFIVFRERLSATNDVSAAARQTKSILDLSGHHDSIKDTLVSIGTYSQALQATGGGRHTATDDQMDNHLKVLAAGCSDLTSAERLVRKRIGNHPSDRLSWENVIQLLAEAIVFAIGNDPRGAVLRAGNAVESHLLELGHRNGVSLTGANGINAKVDAIKRHNQSLMPTKIGNIGKYLGHVRNAADHGIDTEVGGAWNIRQDTGMEYVFVACTFISVSLQREVGGAIEI